MKTFFKQINCILSYMGEFLCSIAYIGFILSTIVILFCTLETMQAITYTAFFVFHLITIAVFGYLSTDLTTTKRPFFIPFIIVNILLIAALVIQTKSFLALPICLLLTLLNLFYIYVTDCLVCYTIYSKKPKLELLFEKHATLWYMLFLALPIICLSISIIFLPISIFIKIGIVVLYILSMPFIALLADSGFDIRYIYQ